MKIFLDTANVEQIRKAVEWGILDGVTTNPTLIAKEGRDFRQVIQEICSICKGDISAEVVSTDAAGMIKEGLEYSKYAKNVVIKCPMTAEGLKATKALADKGIKVNVTLVFSANQALLAAKAGATYVSPFVGRLDDAGQDGMELVGEICQIFRNYGFKTQVLAASIRHPMHVVQAAKLGAHVATLPFEVLEKMLRHPLTDKGLKAFLDDWEKFKHLPRK
ncbi:MAG TPA: fructose-6-phosphate aldolase [Candidatus Diapherotrites archaeon]|uniref:Probable transaldolase n=1 Tax=Candidatus Iainarchaeum sp. TaxID=3101447 RepID=A0A7J4JMW0_9ARCH|nr:fructose-6-phosphate aldolase [Candidatus Diapherotrites archaeon]HIH16576.1 fructose-6-phosphate aldolase [Candidatus Diapherotrites archaeon]